MYLPTNVHMPSSEWEIQLSAALTGFVNSLLCRLTTVCTDIFMTIYVCICIDYV
jgi:hypothetical protein